MRNFRNATVRIATKKVVYTVKRIDECHALMVAWAYALTWKNHKL